VTPPGTTPSDPPANPPSNPPTNPPTPPTPPAQASTHHRCGWFIGGDPIGEASFKANAAQFDTIHPKWLNLNPDGLTVRILHGTDDPAILAAAQANHVRIMPLVDTDDVAYLRLMLSTAQNRATHVANLVQLVHDHGWAGIDIDYEHLWSKADRPGFVAFMQALSTALHADGKELSMAVSGISVDDGNNAYDYDALSAVVDVMHVMGYDFHYVGGDHLGPIAPLGWIRGVFQHAQATGHGDHFILGVPNYAIGATWYDTTSDAIALCQGAIETTTDHMASCPYGNFEAGRAPHCATAAHGEIWFDDVASMEEKIAVAQSYGARGVTYWTLGHELPGYFDMVRKHYP
jgi:spore germination protein YaaH